jgi:hypothetical protein
MSLHGSNVPQGEIAIAYQGFVDVCEPLAACSG